MCSSELPNFQNFIVTKVFLLIKILLSGNHHSPPEVAVVRLHLVEEYVPISRWVF